MRHDVASPRRCQSPPLSRSVVIALRTSQLAVHPNGTAHSLKCSTPGETLAGLAFMPRTVDKLRMEMPGGNMVAAWLRERISPELAVETSAKLATMTMDRLPPEFQERVRQNHPILAGRPELNTFFEIFEADDAAAYGSPQ